MKYLRFFYTLKRTSLLFSVIFTLQILPHASSKNIRNNSTKGVLGVLEKRLPNARIKTIRANSPYKEAYEIFLRQPTNHKDPSKDDYFYQRIILMHRNFDAPVVLITEGYSIGKNYIAELAKNLSANEIRVEHRFFGKSLTAKVNWKYLNIEQSALDYHRIVSLFKKIYIKKNQWVNAGWSKGGQTALFHRRFFPRDVSATLAYDAPINFASEDPRIDRFFEKVKTISFRNRIRQFQRLILKRKKQILPLFLKYAKEHKLKFSIGLEKALEYAVLEYQFSFWQYHHIPCDKIPGIGANKNMLFKHLVEVVNLSSYSDKALNSPAMYQFATELGYYRYLRFYLLDLLSDPYDYSNFVFAPQKTSLEFHPCVMRDIYHWLLTKGNEIIYIYGSQDPWSACGIHPSSSTNSKRYTFEGGNHFTFIKSFSQIKQKEIISLIKKWLYLNK